MFTLPRIYQSNATATRHPYIQENKSRQRRRSNHHNGSSKHSSSHHYHMVFTAQKAGGSTATATATAWCLLLGRQRDAQLQPPLRHGVHHLKRRGETQLQPPHGDYYLERRGKQANGVHHTLSARSQSSHLPSSAHARAYLQDNKQVVPGQGILGLYIQPIKYPPDARLKSRYSTRKCVPARVQGAPGHYFKPHTKHHCIEHLKSSNLRSAIQCMIHIH